MYEIIQPNYLSSLFYSFHSSPTCVTTTHSSNQQTIHYVVRIDLILKLMLTSSDNWWEFTFLWACPFGNTSFGFSVITELAPTHSYTHCKECAAKEKPWTHIYYSLRWIKGDSPQSVEMLWLNPNLWFHLLKRGNSNKIQTLDFEPHNCNKTITESATHN